MQCPKCQTVMREREKETPADMVVVMDVCPSCGGIWLDRGELEKLSASESRYYQNARWDEDDDDEDDDRRRRQSNNGPPPGYAQQGPSQQGYGQQQPYPKKKKGGFLGNIFEGFGGADD